MGAHSSSESTSLNASQNSGYQGIDHEEDKTKDKASEYEFAVVFNKKKPSYDETFLRYSKAFKDLKFETIAFDGISL